MSYPSRIALVGGIYPCLRIAIDERGKKPISDHFGHAGSDLSDAHWRGKLASPDYHVELIHDQVQRSFPDG